MQKIERMAISDDIFVRKEGHLIYAKPHSMSDLLAADEDMAYESFCHIFDRSKLIHSDECVFKLKRTQEGGPILVIEICSEQSNVETNGADIELNVPEGLIRSNDK